MPDPAPAFYDVEGMDEAAKTKALAEIVQPGTYLELLLEGVTDLNIILDLWAAMHRGDWRSTIAGVLDTGPLLWAVSGKPKKKEEWLSHAIR